MNSVVLPAPLGPMTALMTPARHREGEVADGLQAAEAPAEAADLKQRLPSPPRLAPASADRSRRQRSPPTIPSGAKSIIASRMPPKTRSSKEPK